jgi:hypothetical protein
MVVLGCCVREPNQPDPVQPDLGPSHQDILPTPSQLHHTTQGKHA